VEDALKDAGCDRKSVQAAFFGNTTQGHFEGQHMIRGQVALLPLGFDSIPIYNLEAACASSSHAFNLAVTQLRAGRRGRRARCRCREDVHQGQGQDVLVLRVRLGPGDPRRQRRLLEGHGQGHRAAARQPVRQALQPFMDVYAALGRGFMSRYGFTQRQIAAVASKNHGHSVHNERSHYRMPMSHRGDPVGAPDHLPDHAAHVLAHLRRRGRHHPVHRIGAEEIRLRPQAARSR
jgi:acetyl-CoA acetyltransferase